MERAHRQPAHRATSSTARSGYAMTSETIQPLAAAAGRAAPAPRTASAHARLLAEPPSAASRRESSPSASSSAHGGA
eukprot:4278137-Prymnesium_polylepis.1